MELQSIINQTPPEIGPFDRWWITNITICNDKLTFAAVPYNGIEILPDYTKRVQITDLTSEPGLSELIASAFYEIKNLAEKSEDAKVITISAPHPSKKVRCVGIFIVPDSDPLHSSTNQVDPPYVVSDLFELASQNIDVSTVVTQLFGFIATKCGTIE